MLCEELTLTTFLVLDQRGADSNPSDISGSVQSDIARCALRVLYGNGAY